MIELYRNIYIAFLTLQLWFIFVNLQTLKATVGAVILTFTNRY